MSRALGLGFLSALLSLYICTACGGSSNSFDASSTLKDTAYADVPDAGEPDFEAPDGVEPEDMPQDLGNDAVVVEDEVLPPDTNTGEDTSTPTCPQKTWPEVSFTFSADGVITTAPAVTPKGYVVFGTRNGTVYAVDCRGKKVWSWHFTCTDANCPNEYVGSVVVTASGTLIVTDDEKAPNFVFFLSEDGVELKTYESDSPNGLIENGGLLTSDGTFVVATNGGIDVDSPVGELWALDSNGTLLAGFPMLGLPAGTSSPATLHNIIYLPSIAGGTSRTISLVAVNLLGQELFRQSVVAENRNTAFSGVAIDGAGYLVVAQNIGFSDDGLTAPYTFLHRFSPFTGTEVFNRQVSVDSSVVGSPVIRKGTNGSDAILAFENGRLAVYDVTKATGNPLVFQTTVPGFVQSAPLVGADGRIYFAVDDTVHVFDSDGNPIAETYVATERVVSALTMDSNGVLYFGTFDGKLHAVGTTSGALDDTAPWPKMHRGLRNTANFGGTLAQCAPNIPLDPFSVDVTSPAASVSGSATVTAVTAEASCTRIDFSTNAGTLSLCYVLTGGNSIPLAVTDSVTLRYDSGTVNQTEQRRLVIWRADGELLFSYFDGLPEFAANTECGGVEPCPVALWGSGACTPKSTNCGRVVYPSVRLELRRAAPSKCTERHAADRGTSQIVKNTPNCPIYDGIVFVPDATKYLERTCTNDPLASDRISVSFLRTGP
ncbi:MAG: PQQ-binding-like beta-propeller repeat protein [Myxococcales bacterium]|nr:PQQ-binding-like beta-propeller repeat protein [Myxococcales bacterium]